MPHRRHKTTGDIKQQCSDKWLHEKRLGGIEHHCGNTEWQANFGGSHTSLTATRLNKFRSDSRRQAYLADSELQELQGLPPTVVQQYRPTCCLTYR
jgi:hypothetical protein